MMIPALSAEQLDAAKRRMAAATDPAELVEIFRAYERDPQLEPIVNAQLVNLGGEWVLDGFGDLRKPYTEEQMANAEAAFADMESADIVRELMAEVYFLHPDVYALADARLVELGETPAYIQEAPV